MVLSIPMGRHVIGNKGYKYLIKIVDEDNAMVILEMPEDKEEKEKNKQLNKLIKGEEREAVEFTVPITLIKSIVEYSRTIRDISL